MRVEDFEKFLERSSNGPLNHGEEPQNNPQTWPKGLITIPKLIKDSSKLHLQRSLTANNSTPTQIN